MVEFLSPASGYPRFSSLFKELADRHIEGHEACNVFSFVNVSQGRHLKKYIIVIVVVVIYIPGHAQTHTHAHTGLL